LIECTSKHLLACAVLAVTGTGMADSIAQERVRPGLWEIAFTVNGRPTTNTYCITPEQANVMNSDSTTVQVYVERAVAEENGGGCTVKHFRLEGNTISLIKACGTGDSEFTTSLVRTYHGDTAETDVVSKTGGRELHIKSTQRRIGVCP
jgi:porphobilinogen deaminase